MPEYNFTVTKKTLTDNPDDTDFSGLLKDPLTGNATGTPFSLFVRNESRLNVECQVDTTGWEGIRAQIVLLDSVGEIVTWETVWITAAGGFDYRKMYDWDDGSRLDVILDQILTNTGSGGGGGDVTYAAPDKIADARTFFIRGSSSLSVPSVNTFASGVLTLAIDMDRNESLNPGTTIDSLLITKCVHRTTQEAQATENYAIQQNKRVANFDITGPMSKTGYYDFVADVTTTDGQKLVVTGSFNVPQ